MTRISRFLLAFTALALACAGSGRWLQTERTWRIFPAGSAFLYSYDDRSIGGTSRALALERTSAGLNFSFLLTSSGSAYTGVGADISGGGAAHRFQDLSQADFLEIDMVTSRPLQKRLILVGFDSSLWKDGDFMSRRYSQAQLGNPGPDGRYRIPMDRFQLADWWMERGYVPPGDTARHLSTVQAFEFKLGIGREIPRDIPDTIWIRSIEAVSAKPLVGAWIWLVPGLLGLAALASLAQRKTFIVKTGAAIAPAPGLPTFPVPPVRQIPLGDESAEQFARILQHLSNNYQRSELDAETVCRETGVPRSQLSNLFRDGLGTSFKAHLNDLRLTEAARLLRTTDRSISEIAFAVGYNGIAHFNRVFRERHGCAPGELRATSSSTDSGQASEVLANRDRKNQG